MQQRTVKKVSCKRLQKGREQDFEDIIAREAMLALNIVAGPLHNRCLYPFATILRTPGEDRNLILGLLFSLGIIEKKEDILSLQGCFRGLKNENTMDAITIELSYTRSFCALNHQHAHPRYSSCGHCGSTQTLALAACTKEGSVFRIDGSWLMNSLCLIPPAQGIFNKTGGTHGAALISQHHDQIILFEDVGRHNAVDKLIGHMLDQSAFPLSEQVLVVSSRASFEIVQKAVMAGIAIVAAFGAVSSLAIELAENNNLTLIGFLSEERFNIYTHAERIRECFT